MKHQKNVRLSEASLEKLALLGSRYGTETTALEVAIDRLYQMEARQMRIEIRTHNHPPQQDCSLVFNCPKRKSVVFAQWDVVESGPDGSIVEVQYEGVTIRAFKDFHTQGTYAPHIANIYPST